MKIRYDGKETVRYIGPDGQSVLDYKLAGIKRFVKREHRGKSLDILAFSDWRVQNIDELLDHVA